MTTTREEAYRRGRAEGRLARDIGLGFTEESVKLGATRDRVFLRHGEISEATRAWNLGFARGFRSPRAWELAVEAALETTR